MSKASAAIAQLARLPQPGAVKTRLQPALTADEACALHAAMVKYMVSRLSTQLPLQLWVTESTKHEVFQACVSLGAGSLHLQPQGDLGERMAAIAEAVLSDYDQVLIVGSDAPGIDEACVQTALRSLKAVDVVIVPAMDGGYVMIGLRCYCPEVFVDMPWGTDRVLELTLDALSEAGRRVLVLPAVPDIDTEDDLKYLPDDLHWQA